MVAAPPESAIVIARRDWDKVVQHGGDLLAPGWLLAWIVVAQAYGREHLSDRDRHCEWSGAGGAVTPPLMLAVSACSALIGCSVSAWELAGAD